MEKAIIFMIIGVVVFVFRMIRSGNQKSNARRKNNNRPQVSKSVQQRQHQTSRSPQQRTPQRTPHKSLISQLNDALAGGMSSSSTQRRPIERKPYTPPKRPTPPPPVQKKSSFLDRDLDLARKSHYSEEFVVEKIKKAHSRGKEMEHHTHEALLRDNPDISGIPGEEQSRSAKNKSRRNSRQRSFKKMLLSPNSLRNAVLFREVLDRKY